MFRQGLIFGCCHADDAKDKTTDCKGEDDFAGVHYLASIKFLWASSFLAWASVTITSRRWAEAWKPAVIASRRLMVSFRSNLMFALTFILLIYHTPTICQEAQGFLLHLNFIDYQRLTENPKKNLDIPTPFLKKSALSKLKNWRGGTIFNLHQIIYYYLFILCTPTLF